MLCRCSMTNNLTSLSVDQLRRAAALKEQIEQLANELRSVLGGSPGSPGRRGRRRGTRSAATRAKMAAAQRARWANVKGKTKTRRGKRKISAAGRARIAAAARARWAAAKRAGRRTLAG